ncbi:MAG: transporter [Opitutus sp.]|nr:transporter [Opitutus sp.]
MRTIEIFPCGRMALLLVAGLGGLHAAAPATGGGLRELNTDRPDATESPFTVDAGHLQLEMDATTYTRNRLDGVRTTEWVFAPLNLRYGVTPNFEAGIFLTPHVRVTEQARSGPKTTMRGVGDTTVRAKINFWGNNGGGGAFGLIADLKLPTAADGIGNDKVEGALTFPVAVEIGAGWEGGAMTTVEWVQTGAGRRAVWANTLTFARELTPDTGAFLELTSAAGDGAHVATFNCGLTRKLGANVQLDCGVNIGLSRTAPDLSVFAGVTRRY